MYQDYKGNYPGSPLEPSSSPNRPLSSFSNLTLHAEKLSNQKVIRWNIEESQENLSFHKKQDFSCKYAQNSTFSGLSSQSSCLTPKKESSKELADYSYTVGTKSYKSIKFSNELEKPYQKNKSYGNLNKDGESYSKRIDLKALTKSLGYSSSTKDLISNLKIQNSKYEEKTFEMEGKKMKACKSQNKLYADLDKSYDASYQFNTKSQYSNTKCHKKLADFLANEATGKCRAGQEFLGAGVVRRQKRKEDSAKMKNYKTWSYKENLEFDFEFQQPKKHAVSYQKQRDLFSNNSLSIADFHLGTCKGEGAFGQVFPAIHRPSKMLVAIKRVLKQKVKHMLDQFINELKIQMFLEHPNIVKLYGFFDDFSYFYIIMEYMEGGSLFSLIKKHKKLSNEQAALRLRQVCLGLKEMHHNSILHRDIKPQNIVITNNVCKLCDFGWSTVCKDRRTTYCGTLDYISPEIVKGQGYDDSVDIWCIGVLAYEMICGKAPFYNISRTETMKKIMSAKYEYPVQLAPKARSFIEKILKKNPQDRLDIDEVLTHEFLAQ